MAYGHGVGDMDMCKLVCKRLAFMVTMDNKRDYVVSWRGGAPGTREAYLQRCKARGQVYDTIRHTAMSEIDRLGFTHVDQATAHFLQTYFAQLANHIDVNGALVKETVDGRIPG